MKCSKCGTEYDDAFNFCPQCAEPKPVRVVNEEPVVEPTTPDKQSNIQCSKCGIEYKSSFNFCPECAEPRLSPVVEQESIVQPMYGQGPAQARVKSFRFKWVIAGIIILLVIVGVTLGLVFGLGGGGSKVGTPSATPSTSTKTTEGFTPTKYVWGNDTSGDGMTFNADGTWNEIQNGVPTNSGTYTVVGDTVNMTFHLDATSMTTETTTTWPLKIEGNRLIDPKDNKNLVKE